MDDRVRLHALAAAVDGPGGAEALEEELVRASAVTVADLVLNRDAAPRLRLAAAKSLTGRVPEQRVATLATHVCAISDDTRLLNAVITALDVADTPSSHVLRAAAVEHGNYYVAQRLGARELRQRATRGDAQALQLLTVLASAPWTRMRRAGEAAVDELIESHGLDAVLTMLGAPTPRFLARSADHPALRLLGLRLLHRSGDTITACLGDDAAVVRRATHDLLRDGYGDDAELWALAEQRAAGHLWALALLHARGHEIRPMWQALGAPAIEVPGVPNAVREAIVRHYTPGQDDTDPRWLIEAALLPPLPGSATQRADERLDVAIEELTRAGYAPEEPVPAGRAWGSGRGTYHVITTDHGQIRLSTLGPFYDREGDNRIVPALADAGFRHIDAELAAIIIPRLAVYYFGAREPLPVATLLFYWQD